MKGYPVFQIRLIYICGFRIIKRDRMNIGMLLNGNYPNDIRVRKEAESLAKEHSVFILCKKEKGAQPFEVCNGVTIHRCISYKNIQHEGIIDVFTAINFIHPYFKKELPQFIEKNNIQALHIHDLPLAKTAYIIGKKYKLSLVLDLHENYPEALKTWFSWRKNPVIRLKNALFFNYKRWKKYEATIIHKFDYVVAVVDEMRNRLIQEHKITKDKIIVVPNSEKKEFAINFEQQNTSYFTEEEKQKFIISYVGGFGPHRGLHTAIAAMTEIKKVIPNVLLILVGPANKDVTVHLTSIIEANQLQDYVQLRKREPFSKVVTIMKESDINIIPHVSNDHTESAVPHKFYQILMSGKPLLTSDCRPMKRLIDAYDIGTYFEAEKPKAFGAAVKEIYEGNEKATEKAQRGKTLAIKGSLNWETTSKELSNLYNSL